MTAESVKSVSIVGKSLEDTKGAITVHGVVFAVDIVQTFVLFTDTNMDGGVCSETRYQHVQGIPACYLRVVEVAIENGDEVTPIDILNEGLIDLGMLGNHVFLLAVDRGLRDTVKWLMSRRLPLDMVTAIRIAIDNDDLDMLEVLRS